MNKFLNSIKKIILGVFAAMLLANAGADLTNFYKAHQAKVKVADALRGMPGIATEVHACYTVPNKGWLCDIELTSTVDGLHLRGYKFFTFEDLQ